MARPQLIFDRESSRAVDRAAVDGYGILSIVLMENAALALALEAIDMLGEMRGETLIICGAGNNGGDGYAAARRSLNEADVPRIHYLNTDLDLEADEDLRPLTRALVRRGLITLHVAERGNGGWFACMETDKEFRKPNSNIISILDAVEQLGRGARAVWSRCKLKEFNIGYECGEKPWAFNHGISHRTLRRMAEHGTSLRITLYPPDRSGQT